jgi:hypothetical protein
MTAPLEHLFGKATRVTGVSAGVKRTLSAQFRVYGVAGEEGFEPSTF